MAQNGIEDPQEDKAYDFCLEVALAFGYTRAMNRLLSASILLPLISCTVINHDSTSITDNSPAVAKTEPVKLHFTSLGHGRTLLFLHGFGANSYSWSKVAQSLAQDHRLILLDLKGHGASPKPDDDAYSLHDHAAAVTAFIMENALQDVTLVGHSLGGGIALLVALKLASQVRNPLSALILIDSVAYDQPLPAFIRILRIPVLAQLSVWLVPDRLKTRQVLKLAYHNSDKITDETVEAYSAPLSLPGAHQALIQTARQIIPPDIEEISLRYGDIRVPTLLVWGQHDRIVPLHIGERLHGAIPNSELIVIENAGHVPQEESPEPTLDAIRKFLRAPRYE